MRDFNIGKLNGGYVVYWYDKKGDPSTRRRFRLSAKNKNDAWAEGERRFDAELALKAEGLTLADIWAKYEEYLKGRKSARDLQSLWKTIGPCLGKYHPLKIDDEKIKLYVTQRKKDFESKNGRKMSVTTIHNEINYIQSVLNFGYRKNFMGKPIKLKKPRPKKRTDVWLTEEEIFKLFRETEKTPHHHVAVALLLGTAGRMTAVLELTWDRVDFEARTIDLRVVRNENDAGSSDDVDEDAEDDTFGDNNDHRKARAFVPMNDGLFDLLKSWKPQCVSNFVVEFHGGPVKSIYMSFKRAAKRANLPSIHPHILRHTAAVHMAASGRPMARISQYLGHSSVAITERVYARFAPDHLKSEAESVDFLSRSKGRR